MYKDPGNILEPDSCSDQYCDSSKLYDCTSAAEHLKSAANHKKLRARTLMASGAMKEYDRRRSQGVKSSFQASIQNRRNESLKLQLVGKSNASGAAFNIINMEYHKTPEGLRLKTHDELVRFRAQARSRILAVKNHVGFNPITGNLSSSTE